MGFNFNGTSAKIDVGTVSGVTTLPDSDWTIAGFFTNNAAISTDPIYHTGNYSSGAYFIIVFNASDNIQADYVSDNATTITLTSTSTYNDSSVHHIRFTRSGDTYTLYVDDVSEDSETNATPDGMTDTTDMRFGQLHTVGLYWDGDLWEWSKWDRALSLDEGTALYNREAATRFAKDLKWYIPMIREYQDIVGGLTVTNSGTTVIEHIAMRYPAAPVNIPHILASTAWEAVINDTLSIGGTGSLNTAYEAVINDALVFGGVGALNQAWEIVINDALVFGGTGVFNRSHEAVINDALVFGGTGSLNTAFQAAINDALVFGGSGSIGRGWQAVINDGLVFGGTGSIGRQWNNIDTATTPTWSNTDSSTTPTWSDTE